MDRLRKVAKLTHRFNNGLREGAPGRASLDFQFYGLKDFFTNIPNRFFCSDKENTIAELRRLHPAWNYI